jgi:deoxyribonuclease V
VIDPWPTDAASLIAVQHRLAVATPPPWRPDPDADLVIGGCFVAFMRGEAGPGHPGDRAFVGAAATSGARVVAEAVVDGVAGASYEPGLLALREGPMLAAAVEALDVRPDVLLVDATGRDHPRRAGLAVHLGAVLDLPSVGVTHRALRAQGAQPGPDAGATSPLVLDGVEAARWVRTRRGVRPVVAHAGWRTDVDVAVDVVRRAVVAARTPEPLRLARQAARRARAEASPPSATIRIAPVSGARRGPQTSPRHPADR